MRSQWERPTTCFSVNYVYSNIHYCVIPWIYPHPATVTTIIIPFLVGPYKASFPTVTARGVDQSSSFTCSLE